MRLLDTLRWGATVLALAALIVVAWSWWHVRVKPPVFELTQRELPPRTLVVAVSGAVTEPGTYTLPHGARLDAALAAAGGAAVQANLAGVNLALKLDDGRQYHIPAAAEAAAQPRPVSALVNLNRATQRELEALRGIGVARARAIVTHREAHGTFQSLDDLVTSRLLPASVLAAIRDEVAVD